MSGGARVDIAVENIDRLHHWNVLHASVRSFLEEEIVMIKEQLTSLGFDPVFKNDEPEEPSETLKGRVLYESAGTATEEGGRIVPSTLADPELTDRVVIPINEKDAG
jgi:hypothetical protein